MLHGVNIKVEEDCRSGWPVRCGKLLQLNLVLRLYDVNDGALLVGGQDVRDVTQASLRRNFALVSQEVAIFDNSIKENIRYGSEGAMMKMCITPLKQRMRMTSF